MLRSFSIKNYKSILDHTIELGRINVFIGENGCGKTNILEALAMAAAVLTDKLSDEELFNRGIRVAPPSTTCSSFAGHTAGDVQYGLALDSSAGRELVVRLRYPWEVEEIDGSEGPVEVLPDSLAAELSTILKLQEQLKAAEQRLREAGAKHESAVLEIVERGLLSEVPESLSDSDLATLQRVELRTLLASFGVYDANTPVLRGLAGISRRTPLGLFGEGLDVAISELSLPLQQDLLKRARCISWLDRFIVDPAETGKYKGHKPGRSTSKLYFHDRFMRDGNDVFSAENANEGILHILFHLTLFMSPATPQVFGIDNIETALNPQLCRDLMTQLPVLAEKHGKQALITTHNPAILDGLNLNDDEQRLFVVSRDDEGHTRTRRIKVKPQPDGARYKLSELWMRGMLGGLPEAF